MSYNSKAKLKTLYIRRILEEETDAEHGLTMRELINRLADLGIEAERKGIYRDIEILREFGVDVRTYQRNPVEYAIEKRDLDFEELMLLIDAVQSCKALTSRQAKSLTTNLKLMASDYQRDLLDRRIHVAGRIKSKSESVFDAINNIHSAMHAKRMIEFKYYHIEADGEKHVSHDGEPYIVTPVAITYDEGFYYLTAWNSEADKMYEFRIDRMGPVITSQHAAESNDAIKKYSYQDSEYAYFGRFGGEPTTATLRVDGDKVEIVLDRFGEAAEIFPQKDGSAKAVVKVRKSPQFFGWIAGLNNTVRIEKPKKLVDEYSAYLKKLLKG